MEHSYLPCSFAMLKRFNEPDNIDTSTVFPLYDACSLNRLRTQQLGVLVAVVGVRNQEIGSTNGANR